MNLLSEGRTTKYLKYATGEILLVVIGILIALQINNWNENRKDGEFETKILKEIANSIQKDLDRNKGIYNKRVKPKKPGIENLIRNFNQETMEPDSMMWQYYRDARRNIIYTFDDGPYESLKSAGLHKVKNDSLRNQLINYFDNILPRGKELLNFGKDVVSERRKNLEDKIYTYEYIEIDSSWRVRKNLDFESLKTNQDFKKFLDMEEKLYYDYLDRLEFIISSGEDILELVNSTLEQDQ